MARKTEVSGSVVREWANSEAGKAALAAADLTVGLRGKFSAKVITLFEKENKGKRYVEKLVPTVRVKGVRVSESGRKVPVTVVATMSEIRAFAAAEGLPIGERGRVSQTVLSAFAARPKATV